MIEQIAYLSYLKLAIAFKIAISNSFYSLDLFRLTFVEVQL